MKHSILTLSRYAVYMLLLLFTIPLKAQETIVTYFKKNNAITAYKDSAEYTSVLQLAPDASGLYELNEYYNNGNLKRHGRVKSAKPKNLSFEGLVESYYDSGTLKATAYYTNNQLIDTAKSYYRNQTLKEVRFYSELSDSIKSKQIPDLDSRLLYYADSLGNVQVNDGHGMAKILMGPLDFEQGMYAEGIRQGRWEGTFQKTKYKFEEWYENGVVQRGITTDSLGNEHPYEDREIQPEYPGGIQNLRMYIAQNYQYPSKAMIEGITGTLMISFMVDTTGIAKDFEVIEDLGYGSSAAGIAVLKRSQKWIPGYQRGIPVKVKYIVPIMLNLK